MTSQWSHSDSWVAGAIAWASASGEVNLYRIILGVDGLNKVLITRTELEQAVRRLCGAGLLVVEGETFRLTAAGEALTAPDEGGHSGASIPTIFTRLERVPLAEREWNLDNELYEAAVATHREQLRANIPTASEMDARARRMRSGAPNDPSFRGRERPGSRSGVLNIAAGASSGTAVLPSDGGTSIHATLQSNVADVWVRAVVPNPAAGNFTVYLNKATPVGVRAAWFAIH